MSAQPRVSAILACIGFRWPSRAAAATTAAAVTMRRSHHLAGSAASATPPPEPVFTPVVGSVLFAPVPFAGSDDRNHLVYELALVNYSGAPVTVTGVEVVDPDTGEPITAFDETAVASRLKPTGAPSAGTAPGAPEGYSNVLAGGQHGMLFLHVVLDEGDPIPAAIAHDLAIRADAAPPGQNQLSERIAETTVDERTLPVLGPPLRGTNYIAADACCDAVRHTRAVLPVNGQPRPRAAVCGRLGAGRRRRPHLRRRRCRPEQLHDLRRRRPRRRGRHRRAEPQRPARTDTRPVSRGDCARRRRRQQPRPRHRQRVLRELRTYATGFGAIRARRHRSQGRRDRKGRQYGQLRGAAPACARHERSVVHRDRRDCQASPTISRSPTGSRAPPTSTPRRGRACRW